MLTEKLTLLNMRPSESNNNAELFSNRHCSSNKCFQTAFYELQQTTSIACRPHPSLTEAVKTEPMPSGGFQPASNRLPEYCMQEAV